MGPEFSDAECRRESRQALTGSTVHDGPDEGEDYSEFLICRMGQLRKASVCVQRNAALARQAVDERRFGELWD